MAAAVIVIIMVFMAALVGPALKGLSDEKRERFEESDEGRRYVRGTPARSPSEDEQTAGRQRLTLYGR